MQAWFLTICTVSPFSESTIINVLRVTKRTFRNMKYSFNARLYSCLNINK